MARHSPVEFAKFKFSSGSREVSRHAFWVLMLIAFSAVPLALTLRNVKLGGSVRMGH